jgi:hypothetical protein
VVSAGWREVTLPVFSSNIFGSIFFLRGTDYPFLPNSLDLTPADAYLGRIFKE